MGYYRKKIVGDQSWNQSHTSKPFGLAKLDRPEKCFFVCFLFCFCSLLFHQWRHCPGASYHFNRDPASLQSFSVQLLACFLLFFFWLCRIPQPGMELVLAAVEARSPNLWTSREFPQQQFLLKVWTPDFWVTNSKQFVVKSFNLQSTKWH